VQELLEVVERLDAHAHAVRERAGPDRHDHELLEVDRVVGVRAAVDEVHHRHGQHARRVAAEVAPQRHALLGRGGAGGGEGDAQDRVRAEAALVRRAVELDHRAVEPRLVERVAARDGLGDLAIDVPDGLHDALAHVGVTAVAQLGGLELARRRPRGHGGAALGARAQHHLHFHGGVAARVEDLAGVDGLDLAHVVPRSS
jgi:hypothetical protein